MSKQIKMEKLLLQNFLIFSEKNEILTKKNYNALISNFSEIEKLLFSSHLKEQQLTKLIYFFRDKCEKILYEEEEIIHFNSFNEVDCLFSLFYLDMLINQNIEVINYVYPFELIKQINEQNKKEEKKLTKIVKSKIIIDLVYNYQNFDSEDEEDKKDDIMSIENYNKEIIKSSSIFLKEFNIDLTDDYFKHKKIDFFYINIINELIKKKKLEDYEYVYNVMYQLDLENIDITETMFDEISNLLNENEDYINDYVISEIEDLYNEKKINFYFFLFKFIFKSPIYIYHIPLLLKTRKFIIKAINTKMDQLLSFHIKDKDIQEKFEFILKKITDSQYYFVKYINSKLKIVLKFYRECCFESKREEIQSIENIISNKFNNESKYKYYLKDYDEAREIVDRLPLINQLYYFKINETLKTETKYQLIIEEWKNIEKAISDEKYENIEVEDKKIISNFFVNNNNKNVLLKIFKNEIINKFIDENKEWIIYLPKRKISLYEFGSDNNYKNKRFNSFYNNSFTINNMSALSISKISFNFLENSSKYHNSNINKRRSLSSKSSGIEKEKPYNNSSSKKKTKKILCSECRNKKAVYLCNHCNKLFCQDCSDYICNFKNFQNHILNKIEENKLNEIQKLKFINNLIEIINDILYKISCLLTIDDKIKEYPSINDAYNFDSQKKFFESINNLYSNYQLENDWNYVEINTKLIELLYNKLNQKLYISRDVIDIDDDFYSEGEFDINEEEFDNNRNNFFYFINVVPKRKIYFNYNILQILLNRITYNLSLNKENVIIQYNDQADNFVRSKDFNYLSLRKFNNENPILDKFYQLKTIFDNFLISECRIPLNYFDYHGNFLTRNISRNDKRGTENYDPPYGWIGIGLNVIKKYDKGDDEWLTNKSETSEWAIAYYSIVDNEKPYQKLIYNIIINDELKSDRFVLNLKLNDKRHWGKVGNGIYLTPNIKTAEEKASIFSINNKKYKIVFMAKVYINGIKEPENTNFWVLDYNNIRIYRILFKEIN